MKYYGFGMHSHQFLLYGIIIENILFSLCHTWQNMYYTPYLPETPISAKLL